MWVTSVRMRREDRSTISSHPLADPRRVASTFPRGWNGRLLMARQIVDGKAPEVPIEAAKIVATLSQQALDIHVRLREIDRDLAVWLRGNDVARRLMTIPGIGPVGATALAASVTDPHQFRSGRQFAAWLGLTPLQKSSGGKERLGRISKMGDKYLRKLLIVGMTSLVRRAKYSPGRSIHAWRICWRENPPGSPPWRWQTRPRGSSGRSCHVARPIVPVTGRHRLHKQTDTRLS